MKKTIIIRLFVIIVVSALFFSASNKAQATITQRGSVTATDLPSGTVHTITKPTGVVSGDFMIAFLCDDNQTLTTTITPPAGWTQIGARQNIGLVCYSYYKVAGGSEGANYSWTWSETTLNARAIIIAYYGTTGSVQYDTGAGNTFAVSTTHALTQITTGVNNALLVALYGGDHNSFGTYSSYTSPLVEVSDTSTTSLVLGIAAGVQVSAGLSGDKSAVATASDDGNGYLISLKETAAPPVPYVWYASNVSPFSYQLGGYVDPAGVQTYGYFRYGTTSPGSTCSDSYGTRYPASSASDSNLGAGTGTQYYSATITGLSANTLYYWCAMARNDVFGSSGYSTFSTDPATPATVSYPASSVYATTATFNGTSNPRTTSTTGWFRYWTANPGSCTDAGGTRFPASGGNSIGTGNSATFYKQQVTGLTPGQAYWYCAISSNAYGTTVGALKTFTMAANVGTSCTLMPGSVIKDANDEAFLQTYLANYEGTLVYKATTNGWTAGNFHTAANNQGPTITVIKSTTNQVFGGYNSFPWDSSGAYVPGDEGFLFNLTNNYRLTNVSGGAIQTYNSASYGPTFGGGHDLGMPNSNLQATGVNYTNTSSYQNPNTQGAYTYLDGGGGSPSAYNFNASEIEVYKLTVCAPSIPTITTPTKTNVVYNGATLGGNITSQGGSAVTARGVCYSTTDTTPTIAEGATCVSAGSGTGVFTASTGTLLPSTLYNYSAYATNTQGTAYTATTSPDSFTTATNLPSGATADSPTGVNSYYVTLVGAVNPNGFTNTMGHFRVYTTSPANCNTDSGGTRFPYNPDGSQDVSIPANSTSTSYSFTVPLNGGIFLNPNTAYYYCGYTNNSNGFIGSANIQSFLTPDGPASPCDPPTSGSMTVPSGALCSFDGSYNGVDSGSGTTNTASLTVESGVALTIGSGKRIGRGIVSFKNGAIITLASGASVVRGGVYVHDADGDNYLDDTLQYIGSSPPAGYIRRNQVSSLFNYAWKIASGGATLDCNGNSAYAYRTIQNLVRDADNDGYKTATAAGPQCVGASAVFNGRTYYNDGSGPN